MKKVALGITIASLLSAHHLWAEIFVYGPGGPAPVIQELAQRFSHKTGEKITITTGLTQEWIEQAKLNADIIYSGSSSMMDGFIRALPNQLAYEDVRVLGVRPAGIVIRSNNPKKINSFEDLLKPHVNIMVVDGVGQVGLYEDMALKNGDRSTLIKLRRNIKVYARNSKEALDQWNSNKNIDALIIWTHWANTLGKSNNRFIPLKNDRAIYRASEIAITKTSKNRQQAGEFIEFLQSKEAQEVWVKMGWDPL